MYKLAKSGQAIAGLAGAVPPALASYYSVQNLAYFLLEIRLYIM